MSDAHKLSRLEQIEVAAKVGCDPRSVAKVVRGGRVRGFLGERIAREIAARQQGAAGATESAEPTRRTG